MDCAWNERLLKDIAQFFVSAAEDDDGFLQHSTLRFSWVRYIPTNRIAHSFWGRLQRMIIKELTGRRLFFSSRGDGDGHSNIDNRERWTADQLRVVSIQYRDEENAPLLPDLDRGSTTYVSEMYHGRLGLPVLRSLGTVDLTTSPDFLDRFAQDLGRGGTSLWRSTSYTNNWFTRMSNLLLAATGDQAVKMAVQKLRLVPLQDKKWVASLNASIFLSKSGGVDIPAGLKLSLLDNRALYNSALKALLTTLGVGECDPGRVIPLIEQRYRSSGSWGTDVLVKDIVFLFWHHKEVPETGYDIFLSCTSNSTDYYWGNVVSEAWLYYPKPDHPYALAKLFDSKIPAELQGRIKFPRLAYFDALEKCGPRQGKNGPEWLQQRAVIKHAPQLRGRNASIRSNPTVSGMSPEFKYIAENMPHYLLGVLEQEWLQYVQSGHWDKYIKAREVPILESPNEKPLETTFLPLPSLVKVVEELGLSDQFGFLEELDGMAEVESVKWNFLARFGVGVKNDLHFWLTLLHRARSAESVQKATVFTIYARLQTYIDEDDVETIQ